MTVTPLDLTGGYTPPGVYIAEQSDPISTATGLPPGRLTLIGRGQGAQTTTEQITFSTEGVRLAQKGIDVEAVSVRVISDDSVVSASDYTLTEEPQSDLDGDHYVRIAATTGAAAAGVLVWVTYEFTQVGYFQPRVFTSPADVQALYGAPLGSGDITDPEYVAVNSPLTLAAEIAFANGAAEVQCVPIDVLPTSESTVVRSALQAGLAKVSSDYSATIIVPLTDGLSSGDAVSLGGDLRGHVATSSAAGYYRVGILGAPLTYTDSPLSMIQTAGLSHSRLILAWASPGGLLYRSNVDGSRLALGHQYLAAAYGGRMAGEPVQQSLTRRRVVGFLDLAEPVDVTTKNAYSAAGVAVTERDREGRMIIRHGTSTDRSNLVSSEPSVTRARDVLITMIQSALDGSDLIGSPMDENSTLSVKSIVAGVLEYADTNNVIVAYDGLQARMQSLNPSVIEVRFVYRPAFPLNYIMVNFSIDLNTGQADLDDTTGTAVNDFAV